MARNGVRYEEVQRAIHQLLQQGETPGVQKIREILGTGSFTTLSEHLRQWKIEREENRDQPPTQALPEPLQALTHELWQRAQTQAHEGLAHYRGEADHRVANAEENMRHSQRQAEDAAQREKALTGHLTSTQAQLNDKCSALARQETQLATSQAALQQAKKRADGLEEASARLQEQFDVRENEHRQALDAQIRHHEERLAQEEKRHEAAEARLMTLLDDERQERQRQEKKQTAYRTRIDKRIETLESALQEERSMLNEEKNARGNAQRERAHYQAAAQKAEQEKRRLQALLDEREGTLKTMQGRLHDAEERLARVPFPSFTY